MEDNFLVGGKLCCFASNFPVLTVPVAATVVDLQFGWASASAHMETGIIAVGFGVEIAGYYCMVDQMYLQGIINSRAFSMDLGGIDSTSGEKGRDTVWISLLTYPRDACIWRN